MFTMKLSREAAVRFVWLIGVVSLLSDMTYQGAHGNAGPYLALLGASGTIVGLVAGAGEAVNLGLRLLFGYLTDRTQRRLCFILNVTQRCNGLN